MKLRHGSFEPGLFLDVGQPLLVTSILEIFDTLHMLPHLIAFWLSFMRYGLITCAVLR